MSRRALKEINWAAIAERILESEKNIFAAFKSRSDGYLRRVSELPESPMKIDWAFYKKNIPVAGMVDKFQKEYESLKVPYPTDSYTSQVEAQEKVAMENVAKFLQESKERKAQYQAEADRLKSLLPFDQMTLEDFAEAYPDIAYNIDKPTIWPHNPEDQPDDRDVPTPMPKADH